MRTLNKHQMLPCTERSIATCVSGIKTTWCLQIHKRAENLNQKREDHFWIISGACCYKEGCCRITASAINPAQALAWNSLRYHNQCSTRSGILRKALQDYWTPVREALQRVELVFKFSVGFILFFLNKTVLLLQSVLIILNDIAKKCKDNHFHLQKLILKPKPEDRQAETKTNWQVWTSSLFSVD